MGGRSRSKRSKRSKVSKRKLKKLRYKAFPELFSNGGSCSNCCLALWCPCVASGKISEAAGSGTYCNGCLTHCMVSCCCGSTVGAIYHTVGPSKDLRERNPTGVEESTCKICCCHTCCPCCA